LLLDCCFNFRSVLHDQAMNSPEGRSANEINVELESAIVTNLIYVNETKHPWKSGLTSTAG
jgi:hypothetical protein